MKWFQDPPQRPEIPPHLDESAQRTQKRINEAEGRGHWRTGVYPIASLPAMVEPRLRAEAAEYVRQVEQYERQRDEWEKTQPHTSHPTEYKVRFWDGPWIATMGIGDLVLDYARLVRHGAPEPVLRRFAAEIYERDRMRAVLDKGDAELAERMRKAAECLASEPAPRSTWKREYVGKPVTREEFEKAASWALDATRYALNAPPKSMRRVAEEIINHHVGESLEKFWTAGRFAESFCDPPPGVNVLLTDIPLALDAPKPAEKYPVGCVHVFEPGYNPNLDTDVTGEWVFTGNSFTCAWRRIS